MDNPKENKLPEVRVYSGRMVVSFLFGTVEAAKEFSLVAKDSISVSGVTLFINGEFAGSLDGNADYC